MDSETCHEKLPTVSTPYFEAFLPETFAVLCDGVLLGYRLGVWTSTGCGMLWSAARAIERDEATCPALAGVSAQVIEETYLEMCRPWPPDVTRAKVESQAGHNLPVVLPPRTRPDEAVLDTRQPVTVGRYIAADIAKFDFQHATSCPLRAVGIDLHALHDSLVKADAFVPTPCLLARGQIPNTHRELYDLACRKAYYAGTWLVRDLHVLIAAMELGMTNPKDPYCGIVQERWDEEIAKVRTDMASGGCCPFLAIPGPLPWAPSACPSLGVTNGLTDEDLEKAESLGRFVEDLHDPEASTRRTAAWNIARCGGAAASAADDVTKALEDSDTETRRRAAMALAMIGTDAASAAPALTRSLADDAPAVRKAAAHAISRIKPPAAEVLDALITQLDDDAPEVQAACADAIGSLGPDAAPAVPAMLRALEAGVWAALWALRRIGPSAIAAVPALMKLTEGAADAQHRITAAQTVVGIAPETPGLLQALVEFLDDCEKDDRPIVLSALREMGVAAKAAVPHIRKFVDDEEPNTSAHAQWALQEIEGTEDP